MDDKEIILTVLSACKNATYTPVQIQKMLFLVDKNLESEIKECPFFNFEPYHYGPFDKKVYKNLAILFMEGKIEYGFCSESTIKQYNVTESGKKEGRLLLKGLEVQVRNYITKINEFVRSLSFTELISVIYKSYPEMKVNSVFRDSD